MSISNHGYLGGGLTDGLAQNAQHFEPGMVQMLSIYQKKIFC